MVHYWDRKDRNPTLGLGWCSNVRGTVGIQRVGAERNLQAVGEAVPVAVKLLIDHDVETVDEGKASEWPVAFVANRTKLPLALALTVTLSVADVPVGLIDVEPTIIAGGTKAGTKVKVEPLRLKPFT